MVRALKNSPTLDEAVFLSESASGQTRWLSFVKPDPDPAFGGKNGPLLVDRDIIAKNFSSVNEDERGDCSEVNEIAADLARMDGADVAPLAASTKLFGGLSEANMLALMNKISETVTRPPVKFILLGEDATLEEKETLKNEYWAELDKWNSVLDSQNFEFVLGNFVTLADCILWPSLVRVDNVYARQFGFEKTIRKDFPRLSEYIQRVGERFPRLVDELDMNECVRLYWQNPTLSQHCGNDPAGPVPETIDIFNT